MSSSSSSEPSEAACPSTSWESGSSNILVVVRCRPLSKDERSRKEEEAVTIADGKTIEIRDPGHHANNLMRQKRLKTRAYAFDHSFSCATPTAEVYAKTTKFLVAGVMEGYNATVFAYGATGSGKTHTMLGNAASPGLMPSTLRDLWGSIGKYSSRSYTVTMNYVEIYNENVRDLLSAADEYLDLREDPIKVREREERARAATSVAEEHDGASSRRA
jgi:kinesin family protein 18/19